MLKSNMNITTDNITTSTTSKKRNSHVWSQEEKDELVVYIDKEFAKNPSLPMQRFFEKYIEEVAKEKDLTPTSVRAMYNITKNGFTENCDNSGVWKKQESKILLEIMEQKGGEVPIGDIFTEVAKKLGRHPNSVKSHFYNTLSKRPEYKDIISKSCKINRDEVKGEPIAKEQEENSVFEPKDIISMDFLKQFSTNDLIELKNYTDAIIKIREEKERMQLTDE